MAMSVPKSSHAMGANGQLVPLPGETANGTLVRAAQILYDAGLSRNNPALIVKSLGTGA